MPNGNELDVSLQAQLVDNQGSLDQVEFAQIMFDCQNAARLAASWQTSDRAALDQLGRSLLSEYLKQYITASFVIRLQQDPGQAARLVNDLSSTLAAVDGSVSLQFGSQFPGGYFPVDQNRTVQPVGIGFIDKMLGGGLLK